MSFKEHTEAVEKLTAAVGTLTQAHAAGELITHDQLQASTDAVNAAAEAIAAVMKPSVPSA
jgi:hypothetical protein